MEQGPANNICKSCLFQDIKDSLDKSGFGHCAYKFSYDFAISEDNVSGNPLSPVFSRGLTVFIDIQFCDDKTFTIF